ncbi:MAG: M3 family metallopeptidase [Micrococcaceae bacterium]
MSNPLLQQSTLAYALPDFRAIRDEDFLPAFRRALDEHQGEIREITESSAEATFKNTFVAWERSGQLLRWVSAVFFTVLPADRTPARDEIAAEIEPVLAEHWDTLYLNSELYRRIRDIDIYLLEGEDRSLAEHVLRQFRLHGAGLTAADREALAEINSRLAQLGAAYSQAMIRGNAEHALFVEDESSLSGLSQQDKDSAAHAAREAGHDHGWLLELSMFTSQPLLARLENRETRRRLFEAAWSRGTEGDNATLPLAREQAHLRAQKASLLGYETFAEYALQDRTAPDVAAVRSLIDRALGPALKNAQTEREILQKYAGHDLEHWDVPYYSERHAQEQYAVSAEGLRRHFELNRVLEKGVFEAATRLYGVTFHEREDLHGYRPEVRVWEVFDQDGSGLGLFLGDFYSRTTKSGGAWMNSIRVGSSEFLEQPVVVNNLNIARPREGDPTLLTLDEVTTVFHEFGHALHGLFGRARFASLSATQVPRDFVEFPSQVNEMWIQHPELLQEFALDIESGNPLAAEVLDALDAAALWGEGLRTSEYLAAVILDLSWHSIEAHDDIADPEAFEHQALVSRGIDPTVVAPRYRSSYFKHIFAGGGGYAAGYYSYLWAEVLDADAVEWFHEHGGLNRDNGDHFRRELLSRGSVRDPLESYRRFRGRDAVVEPLLNRRGLLD